MPLCAGKSSGRRSPLLFATETGETAPETQTITGTKLCLIASLTRVHSSRTLRTLRAQIAPGTHTLRVAGMYTFLVAKRGEHTTSAWLRGPISSPVGSSMQSQGGRYERA